MEDGDGIELVQRYDSKSGEWTEVAGMLIPRSGSAACLLGGYIYVIGMNHFVVKTFLKSPLYLGAYGARMLTFRVWGGHVNEVPKAARGPRYS